MEGNGISSPGDHISGVKVKSDNHEPYGDKHKAKMPKETIKSECNGSPAHELALGIVAINPIEDENIASPMAEGLEDV